MLRVQIFIKLVLILESGRTTFLNPSHSSSLLGSTHTVCHQRERNVTPHPNHRSSIPRVADPHFFLEALLMLCPHLSVKA